MKILTTCVFLIFSMNSFATDMDKAVYGDDDRKDVYESTNDLYKQLADSTAAMIPINQLIVQSDASIRITGITLASRGICSDEKFAKQMTAADCSGFLVGDQYLVTAGHCIESVNDCYKNAWVFGYANTTSEKNAHVIARSDIYTCTEVISHSLDEETQNDYSLVKLERKVEGHTPLKFRTTGKIEKNEEIVVIGHPSGLPTKIADGAYVRHNKDKFFFETNLDTFGGNSGSAVFDARTGLVEGILVRGEKDYVKDSVQNCLRPKVCKMEGCDGEEVTRITNIKALMTMPLL